MIKTLPLEFPVRICDSHITTTPCYETYLIYLIIAISELIHLVFRLLLVLFRLVDLSVGVTDD